MSAISPYTIPCGEQKTLSLPSTEQLLAHSRGAWGSDVAVVRGISALDASLSISAIEDTWDSCKGGSEEGEGDEDTLDGNHFDCWKRKILGKARRLSEC